MGVGLRPEFEDRGGRRCRANVLEVGGVGGSRFRSERRQGSNRRLDKFPLHRLALPGLKAPHSAYVNKRSFEKYCQSKNHRDNFGGS